MTLGPNGHRLCRRVRNCLLRTFFPTTSPPCLSMRVSGVKVIYNGCQVLAARQEQYEQRFHDSLVSRLTSRYLWHRNEPQLPQLPARVWPAVICGSASSDFSQTERETERERAGGLIDCPHSGPRHMAFLSRHFRVWVCRQLAEFQCLLQNEIKII